MTDVAESLEKLRMLRFDYEMGDSLEFAILDIAMELEERIGELESENAKLREADAVNDLALSYVAIKADRDACKKLLESYMAENDALYMENIKLECRVSELEELVQDWQALYEYPDYGDCIRLRKRMQELGIEVIDE